MKDRKIPMRRCAGCMTSREKQNLIRIAAYEGKLTVDPTGRAKGRGVYLCRDNPECRKMAYKKKALERALDVSLTEEEKNALFEEIEKRSAEGI